jgi:hypothetical protein
MQAQQVSAAQSRALLRKRLLSAAAGWKDACCLDATCSRLWAGSVWYMSAAQDT